MGEHKNKSRAPLRPLNAPTLALSSGGLGFLRPAPGTWGSLPPAGLAAILLVADVSVAVSLVALGVLLIVASVACVVWGRYAEERFGRKDAAEVVADEVAGCAIPVLAAVSYRSDLVTEWAQVAGAFVLFRVMDVLKPWPARRLERLPYGWGVLVDDLVAGVYALVAFGLARWGLAWAGVLH
jgi:phosphatidylglycerophosphatase A